MCIEVAQLHPGAIGVLRPDRANLSDDGGRLLGRLGAKFQEPWRSALPTILEQNDGALGGRMIQGARVEANLGSNGYTEPVSLPAVQNHNLRPDVDGPRAVERLAVRFGFEPAPDAVMQR